MLGSPAYIYIHTYIESYLLIETVGKAEENERNNGKKRKREKKRHAGSEKKKKNKEVTEIKIGQL